MTEDGEKDRNEGQERPSRPATAAARREKRRASARSTAKPAGKPKASENRTPAGKPVAKGAEPKSGTAGSKNGDSGKGRPTPTRDKGDKRPSLFARIGRFLREVVGELRKVIWPTRKQMITYTIVVLVFVVFMVALVSGLDLALNQAVLWIFG